MNDKITFPGTDNPVDIALFLPSLDGGGAEKVFVTLAGLFASRGHAVDLVVARPEGPLLSRVPPDVRLVSLEASRPIRGIPALVRYLRRMRPRALLSALTHTNIAAAIAHRMAATSGRCVLSERCNLSVSFEREKKSFDRWLINAVGRRVFKTANAIIAVSEGVADNVQQLFQLDPHKMHVIYNPIDIGRIRREAKLEAGFPWKDRHPVFIAVGRLTPQKNFPLLLRSFKQVLTHRPCHLAILGEGESRQSLECLASSLGIESDVWLPGYQANPYAFMARSHALVSSSDYEGLSNVLIEGLALKLQVVATDCPSGSAEILAGGNHGFLVPPRDEKALADAMIRAITQPISVDFEKAIERFSPERITDQYLDVLGITP